MPTNNFRVTDILHFSVKENVVRERTEDGELTIVCYSPILVTMDLDIFEYRFGDSFDVTHANVHANELRNKLNEIGSLSKDEWFQVNL